MAFVGWVRGASCTCWRFCIAPPLSMEDARYRVEWANAQRAHSHWRSMKRCLWSEKTNVDCIHDARLSGSHWTLRSDWLKRANELDCWINYPDGLLAKPVQQLLACGFDILYHAVDGYGCVDRRQVGHSRRRRGIQLISITSARLLATGMFSLWYNASALNVLRREIAWYAL